MGEMANGNEITTVEMHFCHKQNGCYCHIHVYNTIK